MKNYFNINDRVRIALQYDVNGKLYIARLEVPGLPFQSRDIFGGLYPTGKTLLNGLERYGFQFQDWVDEMENEQSVKELQNKGIYSMSWFDNNIIPLLYDKDMDVY